jgi:purine-binding chemotaxis protein CheW
MQFVLFALDEQRYALVLCSVERVVRIVDVTPLPKAPGVVLGVINAGGDIVPVFDLRQRFRLPEREIILSDHLIIARTSKQRVALVVDSVSDVVDVPPEKIITAGKILPEMEYVKGVVKFQDGLVLIHDLDEFLSSEEEKNLDEALKEFDELVMRNA